MFSSLINFFATNPANCSEPSFFGLPTWYHYLPLNASCQPELTSLNDIWLVVAAVIEILLRLAGIVAIIMIIVGGVEFISSNGDPNRATKARGTVINALIGLAIAIGAAAFVGFIAGSFKSS